MEKFQYMTMKVVGSANIIEEKKNLGNDTNKSYNSSDAPYQQPIQVIGVKLHNGLDSHMSTLSDNLTIKMECN